MKPVKKGAAPRLYSNYKYAKPDLIDRLGPHCSYCESFGRPTALDVEHIYPKDAHPLHKRSWDNFLIACKSCNSKKNGYLGSGRQRGLRARFLWPHIDNTARAFQYNSDGSVVPSPRLAAPLRKLAEATLDMIGAMANPANASTFDQMSIPYAGVRIREEIWREAESIKIDYLRDPQPNRAQLFARLAVKVGHFSIWMEVFSDRPEFRRELVTAFNADSACFDNNMQPVIKKGRL